MKFYDFKRLVISMVYTNTCPLCEEKLRYNEYICDECAKKIQPPPYDTPIALTNYVCATVYDDFATKVVYLLKNGTAFSGASVMAYYISKQIDPNKFDVITSVPLHKKDRRKRGFNQSELIAKELAGILGKPYCRMLVKTRQTKPQKALKYSERIVNVDGAFDVKNPRKICGRRILLVDDVCTTGSTLSECESMLRKAHANTVICASFAKTILKHKENKVVRN